MRAWPHHGGRDRPSYGRRLTGRIERQLPTLGRSERAQLHETHPRPDTHHTLVRLELEQARETVQRDSERERLRWMRPSEPRPASDRQQARPILRRCPDQLAQTRGVGRPTELLDRATGHLDPRRLERKTERFDRRRH